MTTPTTQKTPSAGLAGTRAEGLNSPTWKKESTTMLSASAAVPTRIALDDSTVVDVDPIVDHVEVTVTANSRITFGLALDRSEARRLAESLLDASAPQFGAADAEEIDEHVAVARRLHTSVTPAKAAAAMREAHR